MAKNEISELERYIKTLSQVTPILHKIYKKLWEEKLRAEAKLRRLRKERLKK